MTSDVGLVTRRRRLLRLTGLGFVARIGALRRRRAAVPSTPSLLRSPWGPRSSSPGSIFFTAAAFLQLLLSTDELPVAGAPPRRRAVLVRAPRAVAHCRLDGVRDPVRRDALVQRHDTSRCPGRRHRSRGPPRPRRSGSPTPWARSPSWSPSALAFRPGGAPAAPQPRAGQVLGDRGAQPARLDLLRPLRDRRLHAHLAPTKLLSSWVWSNVGTFLGAGPFPRRRPAPAAAAHGVGVITHREEGAMDWTLEVVLIPVSDVDRAKEFYVDRLGFALDVDDTRGGMRVVQTTPPGSPCSVSFGRGRAPGRARVRQGHAAVRQRHRGGARAPRLPRGWRARRCGTWATRAGRTAQEAGGTPSCSSTTRTATPGRCRRRPTP